jgi:hypothetical protein
MMELATRGLSTFALLLSTVLLLATASSAHAQVTVVLSSGASSNVTATLLSMDDDLQNTTISGAITAQLQLTEHPLYGTVVQSIELLPGSLSVGNLGWSVSGTEESLTASLSNGSAKLSSSPVAATATGVNTASLPTSDFVLKLSEGQLVASGTVLEHPIAVSRALAADPRSVQLEQSATVVTTPLSSGAVAVELHIPIAEGIPLDPPFLVSWLAIEGELVLSGTTPVNVPSSPNPLWIAAALLAATMLALRRPSRRRTAQGPSSSPTT